MQDIKKLKVSENMDHILLHIVFDEKFPYTPPFVRVVKPVINGGYVTAGGAICMELLTPQVCGSSFPHCGTTSDWDHKSHAVVLPLRLSLQWPVVV